MSAEEIKNMKDGIKSHFGLISKIARKADVKRMIVYRALNGKSRNLNIILIASELYLEAQRSRYEISKKVRENVKKSRSLK
jgi:DNA-binding phage protein